jgi:hypothetical protein
MIRKTVRFDTALCRWCPDGLASPWRAHTVYIVRDAADRPLYVGRTWNVSQRAKAHKSRAKATWWPRMAHVELIITCCRQAAAGLELRLITGLRPAFNADPRLSAAKAAVTRRRFQHLPPLTTPRARARRRSA